MAVAVVGVAWSCLSLLLPHPAAVFPPGRRGGGGVSEGGDAALSTVGHGAASGDRGFGGDADDGGVACAPSSWAKTATSISLGESTFRFLAALVSLGDKTRLPMWAAATAGAAAFAWLAADAATWA